MNAMRRGRAACRASSAGSRTNTPATGGARPASASAALSSQAEVAGEPVHRRGITPRADPTRRARSRHLRGGRHGWPESRISPAMPSSRTAPSAPAIVLGGGIAGLATARLLARHFPRVLVLERDVRDRRRRPRGCVPLVAARRRAAAPPLARLPRTPPAGPARALAGRARSAARPTACARSPSPTWRPPGWDSRPEPADEDVVLLACRRTTFEWALRASVQARPEVELREGVQRDAASSAARATAADPWVRGVRLSDGSELPAALVVDALGRRSPVPGLADGARSTRSRGAQRGYRHLLLHALLPPAARARARRHHRRSSPAISAG